MIAKTAGYDSLFIDMEHTTMSLKDVAALSATALGVGITPFVRVPWQSGHGFVQRVLDAGAMGVIYPHISSVGTYMSFPKLPPGSYSHCLEEARSAIWICKYAPEGGRSLTGGLPQLNFRNLPAPEVSSLVNESGSTVFIMIETKKGLECVDEIAALPGLGVLLVGSNDLASEIGTLGQWEHPDFIAALEKVGRAARKNNVVFGIAGLYHKPEIIERVVNEFGARWVVGANDVGLLSGAAAANVKLLSTIQKQ
jgi:2-keto-3-deoxy-L-rhamnonate aldolase RhmA